MNRISFGTESSAGSEEGGLEVKKNKFEFKTVDTVYAWLSLLLGYLFSRLIPVSSNSLGALLYVISLFVVGFVYIKLSNVKLRVDCYVFTAVIAVFSIGFITCGNSVIRGFLFLFLICIFAYWIYSSFGLGGKKILSENLVEDFISATFVNPFKYIWCIFPGFVFRSENKKRGKVLRSLRLVMLGLAVAVIPTAIIVSLLSYDDSFTALLDKIFDFSFDSIFRFIGDIHLGFIFATVLYGAFLGAKRQSFNSSGENCIKNAKKKHLTIPRILVCTAVTPILLVYILFFISQWDYYISAFTSVLPDNLTYAEYAREGFFQLCWVCVINAVMMLWFNIFIKSNGKKRDLLKSFYIGIIAVFSMILIATAFSKMLLYIDIYGLTRKRVYVTWFIIVLAVFFILVLLKQIIRRLPMISLTAVLFVILFAVISIPDVDSFIASYNVNSYISGKHDTVDVASLEEYGASAVPALLDLYNDIERRGEEKTEKDEKLLTKVKGVINNLNINLESDNNGIFSFNIPERRAKDLLEDYYSSLADSSSD